MSTLPALPAVPTSGRATAALVLGVVALALGFTGVALGGAVVGNVMGSLALQDIDASDGHREGRGRAVAGMVCCTVALVLWAVVLGVAAAVRGT